MSRLARRLGVLLAAAGLAAAAPATARAADDQPCGAPYQQGSVGQVQKCPLVMAKRGYIPVHRFEGGRAVEVGRLNHAGTGNWFVCQDATPDAVTPEAYVDPDAPTLRNRNWAYTLSDDNQWGWVNEIYFAGGVNDEPDAGLKACDPPPSPEPAPQPTPTPTPPPAPTATVDLQAGVQCTPPGEAVITTMTVRRRAGEGKPRVRRVRFFVKRGKDVVKVDRRAPFRSALVPKLPAGTRARVYARVTYVRPGQRKARTRTVSKPFEICA